MKMFEELVKVNKENNTVSARELHEFLEIRTRFDTWFERMISYGFEENSDFRAIAQKRATAQGNMTTYIDYEITLDMAKELSMIQRSEKGKQARQYFIQCEKENQRLKEENFKLEQTNLLLNSMLLTHKQKLELTKNIFYPILESMNVFPKKKNKLHTMIIKRLFGKYENLNKLTKIKDEDIDKYRNIAKEYESDTEFFSDINQITIFEVLNDCAIGLQK